MQSIIAELTLGKQVLQNVLSKTNNTLAIPQVVMG